MLFGQVKLQLGGDQQEISVQRAIVGDRERQIQELKERLKEAESKLYDEQMAKEDAEDEMIEIERKLKNLSSCKEDLNNQFYGYADDSRCSSMTPTCWNSLSLDQDR